MDNNKWRNKRNIIKLLQSRETKANTEGRVLKSGAQFNEELIKRLGLEYELQGHQGCVNCLQWSADGKTLASGSDDTNVILWDPFRHKLLGSIPTNHIGNIFSVKFVGGGNTVATAAGDCRILVQAIEDAGKNAPILDCNCHANRVKRLATTNDEPSLFWSASEDGQLRQFDLREPHECINKPKPLISLSYILGCELKCATINPAQSNYIAVGANDCYVRMYDRRLIRPGSTAKSRRPSTLDHNVVQYYAPGHLAMENAKVSSVRLAVTYVSFNAAGTELLANIGGEQIYLFDVNNKREVNEVRIPRMVNKRRNKENQYRCKCRPESNGLVKSIVNSHDTMNDNCACFYMRRAYKCLRRNWIGDLYSAARDYLYVIEHWPDQNQAYLGLIKCLINLKWLDEAEQWIEYYSDLSEENENSPQIKHLNSYLYTVKNSQKDTGSSGEDTKDCYKVNKLKQSEISKRMESYDYEERFVGHCNTTTDIKEANFLGEGANYICAGSDEGIIFIWERRHSSIVNALFGDVSIVNCIQPHPSACFIASSGIDPVVKLWSPLPEDDESENPRRVKDITAVVEANQKRMSMDPFESMLVNMGYHLQQGPLTPDGLPFNEMTTCRTC